MNSTEQMIRAGNVALASWSTGKGAPIVVLGGPWFGHSYLNPLVERLAQDFRVITYDARGSGQSSALTADQITLDGHVSDLESLRVGLGIERLNLIGHSFGAHVSMQYAAQRPQTIASLVLANPGPPFDAEMQKAVHGAFVSGHTDEENKKIKEIKASPGFMSRDARTHEELFKTLYASFFKDRRHLADLEFGFTPTTALYALGAEQPLVRQLLERDPAGALHTITCPTLVLHAEHDLIPEAFSRFLASGIHGAEYARLNGVGHFAYLENPALFTNTVATFLKKSGR